MLRTTRWRAIAAIVAASTGLSLAICGPALLAFGLPGRAIGLGLALAAVVPIVVGLPIGALIVDLLRELDAARREAARLAETDPLTGVLNRRRFVALAERERLLAVRAGAPMSVLMLDLDDFKRVNDRCGHAAGDHVLVAVADACRQAVRTTDWVARWGGEEFVIALPATGPSGASVLAERLRGAVSAIRFDGEEAAEEASDALATLMPVTVSVGIASVEPGGPRRDLEQLIGLADAAMYRAKRAGKNRVELPVHLPATAGLPGAGHDPLGPSAEAPAPAFAQIDD